MAVILKSHEVSDLCLGKPALFWLPVSATVADALKALKESPHAAELAVWNCSHSKSTVTKGNSAVQNLLEDDAAENGECIGKICMVDVICFLSKDSSLREPERALSSPVSVLLASIPGQVRHIDARASLLDGLDLIVEGAENLIVPIETFRRSSFKKLSHKLVPGISSPRHGGKEFCWITQEDVVRFLLGFISVFNPLPSMTVEELGLVNNEVLMIDYEKPASSALSMIQLATHTQTAVAVVSHEDGNLNQPRLIGEISPSALALCDETVSLALATLSAGDFMAYVAGGVPPEDLVNLVRMRVTEKIGEVAEEKIPKGISSNRMPAEEDSASSDEESLSSPTGPLSKSTRSRSMGSKSFAKHHIRGGGAPLTCRPWSSLVAVMVQALANRLSYVWVTDEDSTLVGIVTFWDILDVFWNHLRSLNDQ